MSTTPVRVLIVDDEPVARRHLRSLLSVDPSLVVIGECGNGRDAVDVIRAESPDLVLLDIQMPELDGFGVVEQVGSDQMPVVVFVTAFDEYALQAFAVHAVDYVLKPINRDRLYQALAHAVARVHDAAARSAGSAHMRAFMDAVTTHRRHDERIAVKVDGRNIFIKTAELDWIEAVDDYVRLHIGRTHYLVRTTMTALERRLPSIFLRVHRSIIVNTDRSRNIVPTTHGDYHLILSDGVRLTSGRSYRGKVADFLQAFTADNL